MDPSPTNQSEQLGPLRRIGVSLLALTRSRLELFTVELQEEKLRLLNLLIWLGVALVLGAAGIVVAMAALTFWVWAVAGYAGLVGLAVTALVIAAVILSVIRLKIQTGPTPFAHTVAEFKKDAECLRGTN